MYLCAVYEVKKDMENDSAKAAAARILDNYLERRGHRKTSERYAILEAVYAAEGHFTLEELAGRLEQGRFPVSRATLYNTLRLFVELRIVTRHNLDGTTNYEACLKHGDHSHLICTHCGRVWEVESLEVGNVIRHLKTDGFQPDDYTLYIYGVCAECGGK